MILYPAASIATRGGGVPADSIEFGRTAYGNDYVGRPDAPTGGTLFMVWSRIPETIADQTFPFVRGNQEIYQLYCGNWYVRCVTGNMTVPSADSTACYFNANSMIFANGAAVSEPNDTYLGDYSYMGQGGLSVPQMQGFNFTAWYVENTGSEITVTLWTKFADGSFYGPYVSTVTLAAFRSACEGAGWSALHAAAFTPDTNAVSFAVAPAAGYNTHARMLQVTGQPSDATVLALSNDLTADPSAWGDWQLTWDADLGAADLSDRSGHSRPLILRPGGTLYQGVPAVLT